MKFIKSAPINHQCSKNYFYGEDLVLEKALQPIENKYAPIITNISKKGYKLKNEHQFLLKKFWLLQYLRTEAASIRSVEMIEEMGEVIGEKAREFRLRLADAVQNAMSLFAEKNEIIDDLKVCLLRNKTDLDFVTSDDPSVLTNKLFLIKRKGESFGLNSAGNLILLPLTPKILLIGYDKHVYSVPQKDGWSTINNKTDIEALNQHQFLNCRANIYVHNSSCSDYIANYYEYVKQNRPKTRLKIHYAVLNKKDGSSKEYIVVDRKESDNNKEALIHYQTISAKPSKWPKQIRWRLNGFAYSNGTGAGLIRQKEAVTMPNKGFRKIKIRKQS